ncbi:MAG: hypothetical protein KF846_02610 [Cyclobacteriaceae bacterium]|nr:hypothetical protein [Cyclobacteriaceae bacterium]MBX2955020.1 hypothetical protein [Cyclobacteriaceae bacterium]
MRLISCIALILIITPGYSQFDNCVLRKSEDEIKVYTCKSDNDRFKTLKAEFMVKNTTLEELENFLRNVANYPNWQYNMTSAEILKHHDDGTMLIRSEIDAPWPVDNRELIAQFSIKRFTEKDHVQFTVKTISTDHPEIKGLVRVPFSHAQWEVKKVDNNINVLYTMRIDPGGSVPPWLVNIAMAEGPYISFINLKRQLEKK